jgi:hypothetical protein
MATRTRVRDLVLVGHRRTDELERVAADVDVGDGLFDLRHMAGDTVAARAAGLVVRVAFVREHPTLQSPQSLLVVMLRSHPLSGLASQLLKPAVHTGAQS